MILSSQTIRYLCEIKNLIQPFHERTVKNGKTFGLSAAGYDVRIDSGYVLLPGHFILAATVERFFMPNDLMGVVHDKSSWARKGLTVQNTIIEPGWSGYLTLELVNHSPSVINIHNDDPIAQIVFHKLDALTCQPYDGKYQNQKAGPQPAIEEQ